MDATICNMPTPEPITKMDDMIRMTLLGRILRSSRISVVMIAEIATRKATMMYNGVAANSSLMTFLRCRWD